MTLPSWLLRCMVLRNPDGDTSGKMLEIVRKKCYAGIDIRIAPATSGGLNVIYHGPCKLHKRFQSVVMHSARVRTS